MKEFIVSEFITLKLEEDGNINIYVNKKKFLQCKYLLLNRKVSELEDLLLDSVDDMAEILDHSMEEYPQELPKEVEFWGHCSNLQIWYENNYDTRLLHSNLAFPLLKELVDLGDPQARRVLKEEIAKRIESGKSQVIMYLIEEKYISYLSREEFIFSLLNSVDAETIYNLENIIQLEFNVSYNIDSYDPNSSIIIENKNVVGVQISSSEKLSQKIEPVIELLIKLKNLFMLEIDKSEFTKLTPMIGKLKNISYLLLSNNLISEIPKTIGNLTNLRKLDLSHNNITIIPETIGNLTILSELILYDNQISKIPITIGNLNRLSILDLNNNQISQLPETIGYLTRLRYFYLQNNQISQLPETVGNMERSIQIDLRGNPVLHPKELRERLRKKNLFMDIIT